MSHYSALLVQRRVRADNGSPVWEADAPTIRIPTVTDVRVVQDIPGGFMEADFTVPPDHARVGVEAFQKNTTVWIYDGLSVCFFGYVEKRTPTPDGGIAVACVGGWKKLGATDMRIVWAAGDFSDPRLAPGSARSASIGTNSFGNLELSFPKDHQFNQGAYAAVDFYLFDEPIGPRDAKKITGWDITIGSSSSFDGAPALEARIYGLANPADDTPVLLQVFNSSGVERQETAAATFGDNPSPWPSDTGYRCIRVGLWAAADTGTYASDKTLVIPEFRYTTRGETLGMTLERQTSTLAKDLFDDAGNSFDTHHLLQEEQVGTTNRMVAGNIPSSGRFVSNIAFGEWTPPSEIIEALSAIDGCKVGMWEPTLRPPVGASVSTSTSRQWWYRQPPALVYEEWADPNDPDYTIRLLRGAVWEPDDQEDDLKSATYVTYTTLKGRALSVYVEDLDQDNYLYEQGWHEATDWSIDPPVKSATAASLGKRYNELRRQPTLAGTVTLYGDRPGCVEGRGGTRITKLSTIRSGMIRIPDAKGPVSGRVTRVEYSARSGGEPEKAVLSVNDPAAAKLDRRLANLARKAERRRTR